MNEYDEQLRHKIGFLYAAMRNSRPGQTDDEPRHRSAYANMVIAQAWCVFFVAVAAMLHMMPAEYAAIVGYLCGAGPIWAILRYWP